MPFWAKSGVCLGKWSKLTAKVGERVDKNHGEQVSLRMTPGATRLEERRAATSSACDFVTFDSLRSGRNHLLNAFACSFLAGLMFGRDA